MAGIYLVSDTRERAVHGCIETVFGPANVPRTISQINTGDFLICRREAGDPEPEILACVERKTLPDLASSIRDGRIDNRQKMMDLRDRTGCQLYFFIEGPAFPKPTWKVSRFPYSTLQSTMTSLMVRDGVHVVKTPNEMGTALRLLDFVKSFARNPIPFRQAAPPDLVAGGTEPRRETQRLVVPSQLTGLVQKTDKMIACEMWARLPGISFSTAEVLTRQFAAACLVCGRVASGKLDGLRTAGGRVLVKKGRASLQALRAGRAAAAESKLLSGIPGISTGMAGGILKNTDLRSLIRMGVAGLSDVLISQRNREVRLGEKRGAKIWRILHYVEVESSSAAADPQTPAADPQIPAADPQIPAADPQIPAAARVVAEPLPDLDELLDSLP